MKVTTIDQNSWDRVLSRLENDISKGNALKSYIPLVLDTTDAKSKSIWFTGMNDNQILAQLQNLSRNELSSIEKQIQEKGIYLQNQNAGQSENQNESVERSQQSNVEADVDGDLQNEVDLQEEEEGVYQGEGEDDQQMDELNEMEEQEDEQEDEEISLENDEQDEYEQQQDYSENGPVKTVNRKRVSNHQNYEQEFGEGQDVGLYGERLDDSGQEDPENMQDYDNEFDQEEFKEFQKQVGALDKKAKAKTPGHQRDTGEQQRDYQNPDEDYDDYNANENMSAQDGNDDNIEDNFDHFRELELKNQKEEKQQTVADGTMDKKIDQLQEKIIGSKDWMLKGQVKARERPTNSLLEYDLQFQSGIKYSHEITKEKNSELEDIIKKRILSEAFDDRQRFANASHIRETFSNLKEVSRDKSKMGLGELYENHFKNFLGLGNDKTDGLRADIMDSFKELNYYLDSLTNFSFTPRPNTESNKRGQKQVVIIQEKVPLTMWSGQKLSESKPDKFKFQSEKQVDKSARRLKTKRILRQRKKEMAKKALNKKIEYGGMTKVEAQARQKAQANSRNALKSSNGAMKYNKSDSFFKSLNEKKPQDSKPNANISKMKI